MVYGENKNLLKSFFVTGGFVEINPEKCIILAEEIDEIDSLNKSILEKKVQELENQDSDESQSDLFIAKSKIQALNSSFYEKI
jgi:F0F1-type ATP synthase epsilon subunit